MSKETLYCTGTSFKEKTKKDGTKFNSYYLVFLIPFRKGHGSYGKTYSCNEQVYNDLHKLSLPKKISVNFDSFTNYQHFTTFDEIVK